MKLAHSGFLISAFITLTVCHATAQSSGRLLVLNKEDATLAIVDAASGKVLGTVPTGEGPHELVALQRRKTRH